MVIIDGHLLASRHHSGIDASIAHDFWLSSVQREFIRCDFSYLFMAIITISHIMAPYYPSHQ
jgi:hypothetical protein